MASLAFVCFMFGFAMTCFARSIPAGIYAALHS